MTESTSVSKHKTTKQGAKHHEKQRRSIRSTLKHHWFEISVLVMMAMGIFLLVEQLEIKELIWRGLVSCARSIADGAQWLWGKAVDVVAPVEASDIVGALLLLTAFVMTVHRGRLRAIKRHPDLDQLEGCPDCGGAIERVRRTSGDRFTELVLWINIRRYACTKCSYRHSSWHTRF